MIIDAWYLNQTVPDARGMANALRNSLNIKSDRFYKDVRRQALIAYCHTYNLKFFLVDEPDIIGVMQVNGIWIPIAVSGHLTNMMMSANFKTFDWPRYLDTIEWNFFKYIKGNNREYGQFEYDNGYLAERSGQIEYHSLWHNYYEWSLSIWSYVLWMMMHAKLDDPETNFNDIIISKYLCIYVQDRLDLLYRYPAFRYTISYDIAEKVQSFNSSFDKDNYSFANDKVIIHKYVEHLYHEHRSFHESFEFGGL
jgi:hypothetical protein